MGAMTAMPRGRELTRADLDAMPDDGWRRELVDGMLLVSPAPSWRHQRVVLRVAQTLDAARTGGLEVLTAAFDVTLAEDTVVQPDVLVARIADLTQRGLPGPPLLAVEVLSRSTRHLDLGLKLRRYEAAGCPSYWVVDPGLDAPPSIRAWRLQGPAYVEQTSATGDEQFVAEHPYRVALTPAALVADR